MPPCIAPRLCGKRLLATGASGWPLCRLLLQHRCATPMPAHRAGACRGCRGGQGGAVQHVPSLCPSPFCCPPLQELAQPDSTAVTHQWQAALPPQLVPPRSTSSSSSAGGGGGAGAATGALVRNMLTLPFQQRVALCYDLLRSNFSPREGLLDQLSFEPQ